MECFIYESNMLIGVTELKPGDVYMGELYGYFKPAEQYFESIQSTVQGFNTGNSDDWYKLNLNAQLVNGCFLFARGGYIIDDMPELNGEPLHINIAGVRAEFITDFVKPILPRYFVEEPWDTITIEQKLFFEDQLRKELPFGHALSNIHCSALCACIATDDILFETNDGRFVLVHLTYGYNIHAAWPLTTFFNSFEEFRIKMAGSTDNYDI